MGSTFVLDAYDLPDNVIRKLTCMVLNGEIQHISSPDVHGNREAQKRVDFVNDLINHLQNR